MNVVLDSYDLLRAIGAHRDAFAAIDDLIRKQATALLGAQLKHKSLDLQRYRMVSSAVGSETLGLFMDAAEDKLLRAVAKKLDPHSPLSKAGDADELRPHLLHLAEGKVQPTAKAVKSPPTARKVSARRSKKSASSRLEGPHAIATKPPGRG